MARSTDTNFKDLILGMDKKLDSIGAQLTDINIAQSRTDERLNFIDRHLDNLESSVKSTDNRLWTFMGILVIALLGTLAKIFLFPQF